MNPRYYILSNAAGTKETGVEYPQVKSMTPGYNLNAPDSVWALHSVRNQKPNFEPNLNGFVLYKKAGLTDVVSAGYIGGRGLLMSTRFKDLLKDFSLTYHVFYPATVYKDNVAHDYFWMHLIESDYRSYVVFPKTEFANEPELRIKDYEEYLEYESKHDKFGLLRARYVTLCRRFDKSLDLFMISAFDQHLYASDRLVDKIREAGITGLEVENAEKQLFFE